MSIIETIRKEYGVAGDTDSYKFSHAPQFVPGATAMMSYIESRGGQFDKVVWFGLQMIIKEYLLEPLTEEQVRKTIAFQRAHLGIEIPQLEEALYTIVREYDGKLPIRIRSIPEGKVVPVKQVLATIETTVDDPRVFPIVSYLETKLMRVWSPTTVATTSYHIKEIIYRGLLESADDPDAEIGFKLHDFGARGVSSLETAAFAGAAHLVNFLGSDTTAGIMAANFAYNEAMAGFSIPATEHSTTISHGPDGEVRLVEQMFDNFAKPGAIFATVADSYDILNFVDNITSQFKQRLIDSGATWVIRPDSGDPVQTPVEVVCRLDRVFGHTVNSKGYRVLNNVRVIQGDGIDMFDVQDIVKELLRRGYSISNIAFGMGGGLLQKNDRDTLRFAMKACAIKVDGVWRDVYKEPAVYDQDWNRMDYDVSYKSSKAGRLVLTKNDDGEYETMTEKKATCLGRPNLLEVVYENGELVRNYTFAQVRQNAKLVL